METLIGCSAIIYDDNRILIAQRGRNKKQCPLLWETVGGALEKGETPEECIVREVKEELNCDIYKLELVKVYIVNENKEKRHVMIVFKGQVNGEMKFNYEIEQVKWIYKNELDEYDFCWNCKQKIIDYYDKII